MSGIVNLTKLGSVHLTRRKRQGLRKLSPDLIGKAIDETNAQVTRIGLTFLGTAAFCLLSLLSPDSALLGGTEKINVPLAGPVSFFGFMLLGPAVLIILRVYLQIYVEHSNRLERLGRSILVVRPPTLVPFRNRLMRVFSGLTFYLVLPMAMLLFAWKGAVFPVWGSGLFCVAVGVIASHTMLRRGTISWRSTARLSLIATIVAGVAVVSFGPLRRPFLLSRTDLSNHWLEGADLREADLTNANLSGAHLRLANLSGAELRQANLDQADLQYANLTLAHLYQARLRGTDVAGANLYDASLVEADLNHANLLLTKLEHANLMKADLSGANLHNAHLRIAELFLAKLKGANLSGANLSGADLSGANLTKAKGLDEACGDENTKLPEGFTVKRCPER